MRFVSLVALMILAGCAHDPEPIVRIVEVKVPVPVACLRADQVPTLPDGLGEQPDSVEAALSRALSRLIEWVAYGAEADAKLKACAKGAR